MPISTCQQEPSPFIFSIFLGFGYITTRVDFWLSYKERTQRVSRYRLAVRGLVLGFYVSILYRRSDFFLDQLRAACVHKLLNHSFGPIQDNSS